MLLADLLRAYLSAPQKRLDIRREATRVHYHRSLRQFEDFLERPSNTEDLTDDNLAAFVAHTIDLGLSIATANQRAKQLRALWEWAARQRLVEKFPTFRGMREPERLPSAWAPGELAQLFRACREAEGWIGPHRASDWWLAQHYWFLDTGERTEATLSLRPEHLNLSGGHARVPAEIRKGGLKAMVYRLSERTCEAIQKVVAHCEEEVFTQPWSHRASYYCRYRRLVKSAGLPHVRHKTGPHKMRITVLTLVQAHGGNATEFARHSSARVTESYIDRTLLMAHDKGDWPRDYDPLDPTPENGRKPWWLRLVS